MYVRETRLNDPKTSAVSPVGVELEAAAQQTRTSALGRLHSVIARLPAHARTFEHPLATKVIAVIRMAQKSWAPCAGIETSDQLEDPSDIDYLLVKQ